MLFPGMTFELTASQLPNEGRIKVCLDGECGTICDYGWNSPDARVMCKQLGYLDGTPLT